MPVSEQEDTHAWRNVEEYPLNFLSGDVHGRSPGGRGLPYWPSSFMLESIFHTGTRVTEGFPCGIETASRVLRALALPTPALPFLPPLLLLTAPQAPASFPFLLAFVFAVPSA